MVYEYKLIVSQQDIPYWHLRPLKTIATQMNLYVRMEDGDEHDDIEHWLDKNFENPAAPVLDKICEGKTLSTSEWCTLIDYAISQYVRTPAFYQYIMEIGKKKVPEVLEEVTGSLANLSEEDIMNHKPRTELGSNLMPLSFKNTGIHPDDKHTILEIGTVIGKSTWLNAMEYFLSPNSEVNRFFHSLKWSIVYASDFLKWPTSDNPFTITKCNKSRGFEVIHNGGVGHKKVTVFFPISPELLLIGTRNRKYKRCFTADKKLADIIRRCLIDNAFMYVYSNHKDEYVTNYRSRIVNKKMYKRIEAEYNDWYDKYKEIEAPPLSSKYIITNPNCSEK